MYLLIDTWNGGKRENGAWVPNGERECYRGTMDGCMVWIHQNTPFSFSEALANQGFEIRETGDTSV